MKKILLIVILSLLLFVCNSTIYASSPSKENIIINLSSFDKDGTITYTPWIVEGNDVFYLWNNCKTFEIDDNIFEIESIDSIYNFYYDKDNNCISNKDEHFIFPYYVEGTQEDIRPLYTITLKIKQNISNKVIELNGLKIDTNKIKLNTNTLLGSVIQDGPHDDNVLYDTYDYTITKEKYNIFKEEYSVYLKEKEKKEIEINKNEVVDPIEKQDIENSIDSNNTEKNYIILIIFIGISSIIITILLIYLFKISKQKNL